MSDRFNSWSLILYNNPMEFAPLLDKCVHYAYILHDKDGVEPHYHLLCTFKSAISLNALKKFIFNPQNLFGEQIKSRILAFDYLTHKDKPDKFQYSSAEIRCDNLEFWQSGKNSSVYDNADFLSDLVALSPYDLALKYGRDYIKNYKKYYEFALLMKTSDND